MDGSKKFERVSKTGRSIRWTQHHWVRCTDIESAMELEDSFEPNERYTGDVETTESKPRGRAQPGRMGKTARESQRELHELRLRSEPGDD